MPDAKGLLHRWSRLKRAGESGHELDPVEDDPPESTPDELPRIETLDADSDYAAFMRRNVPAALRRAALRRAWTAEASIARHKPLVDYDWDYNAAGFGKLWPGDDPARLIATIFAARWSGPADPAASEAPEEPVQAEGEASSDARARAESDGSA